MNRFLKHLINSISDENGNKNIENFSNDFEKFINERILYPFIDLEKSNTYHTLLDNFNKIHQNLEKNLTLEQIAQIDKLINLKSDMKYLYINSSYQTGFIDGITIALSENIKKD